MPLTLQTGELHSPNSPFRPFSTHSICAPPFIQCVSGTFNIFQGKHSPEKKENQQEEKQEQLDYAKKLIAPERKKWTRNSVLFSQIFICLPFFITDFRCSKMSF